MHTHSLADYMERVYRGDWKGVGALMLSRAVDDPHLSDEILEATAASLGRTY